MPTGPAPERIKPDLRSGPPPADNGPTREDLLFFRGQFEDVDEKIAELRTRRKATRRQAKVRGIDVTILDEAIRAGKEEDDTTINRLRTFKRYATLLDLPIGPQLELFDAIPPSAPSEEALLKRARDAGFEHGILGKNPDDDAYPPALPEGQAHMEGWHAGQKVNRTKFLKLNEDIAASEAVEKARKAKKTAADANGDGSE